MHLLFVYGTLKTGEPNYEHMINPGSGTHRLVGTGRTVDKWPLVIASKYNIPYLLYVKDTGKNIVGEVYEVDDAKLAFMDDFEGHPTYYERELTSIKMTSGFKTDSELECWAYFLKEYKPYLLDLPLIEDYVSAGPHNLPYISRYERLDIAEYDAVADVIKTDRNS